MYKVDEVTVIAESIKNVRHSKQGRYFVTCRAGDFLFLPIEDFRTGDVELGFYVELDLICGLSPGQWWTLNDRIDDYMGEK